MLYKRRSFSVSSIQNSGAMCAEKGHSGADSRGCCFCCGEKIDPGVALVGGPFDGQTIRASKIIPSGRTNIVRIDGMAALYDLEGVALVFRFHSSIEELQQAMRGNDVGLITMDDVDVDEPMTAERRATLARMYEEVFPDEPPLSPWELQIVEAADRGERVEATAFAMGVNILEASRDVPGQGAG